VDFGIEEFKNYQIKMKSDELKKRTKDFALRIYALVNALPDTVAGRTIAVQLFKAGTSVAANYRATCRGRSKAEFKSKLHIVLEEIDESQFWLEFIIDAKILPEEKVILLLEEATELTAIFTKSYHTASK
jgi:four helix bundle protein